jgi:hypothetical protein
MFSAWLLKAAVDRALIADARQAIHEWGQAAEQSKGHPNETDGIAHSTNYLPPRSDSRYIFHAYTFHPGSKASVVQHLLPVFEEMRQIYCGLIGEEIAFSADYDGYEFLPQVIQYPRGGGFFQEHFHKVYPQRIGMVLGASDLGADYKIGGGRFRDTNGQWVTTEGAHQTGDLSLFRYDIGHDITPVDPDAALDWSAGDGRWTFILPLKPLGKV